MYSINKSGVTKKLETWTLLIPFKDNDGIAFPHTQIDEILNDIILTYPGFSIVNCIGYWKDQKETYIDKNRQVIIDTFPLDTNESESFFTKKKEELAKSLRQEKIYVTKTGSKEELISFKEFFTELGLEIANQSRTEEENIRLAEQIISNQDFVLKRLGYETLVLQRDKTNKKIIWERKICGIRVKSEFEDTLSEELILCGADQIDLLGEAIFGNKPIAIIGDYEYQKYILEKFSYRPLIEAKLGDIPNNIAFIDQQGNHINTKRFIELFTMSVFCNYMALREENYLSDDIKINIGQDGSMQIAESKINGNNLLHNPAIIKDKAIQLEIIRCVTEAVNLFETNQLDSIALLQAKARSSYIKNRAALRKVIKSKLM